MFDVAAMRARAAERREHERASRLPSPRQMASAAIRWLPPVLLREEAQCPTTPVERAERDQSLIDMLTRPEGVSSAEIELAFGWRRKLREWLNAAAARSGLAVSSTAEGRRARYRAKPIGQADPRTFSMRGFPPEITRRDFVT